MPQQAQTSQILGTLTNGGSTLTLEGNALRTDSSIIALNNITQIKCIDATPEYKLNWKLIAVLAVAGFGLLSSRNILGILVALACFGGIGYLVYSYMQKLKQKLYALDIELSAGSGIAYYSDDLDFLNQVKNKVFDAIQNGSATTSFVVDMSKKTINNGIINTGAVGGNVGSVNANGINANLK